MQRCVTWWCSFFIEGNVPGGSVFLLDFSVQVSSNLKWCCLFFIPQWYCGHLSCVFFYFTYLYMYNHKYASSCYNELPKHPTRIWGQKFLCGNKATLLILHCSINHMSILGKQLQTRNSFMWSTIKLLVWIWLMVIHIPWGWECRIYLIPGGERLNGIGLYQYIIVYMCTKCDYTLVRYNGIINTETKPESRVEPRGSQTTLRIIL